MSSMRPDLALATILTAGLVLLLGSPGSLSGSPGEGAVVADTIVSGDTIPLDPVEVTVLRTVTPLSASPMAVSALGEERLRSGRSGTFLEEALQGLPGVQVQNRFNPAVGERVAIRGFGARAQFGVRGVRVVVDGIPATLPDGQSTLEHIDLGSIGRVEAIRGPASSLFGNASGGVLAFHSAPPGLRPFGGEGELVFGSHGHVKGQTTASGTIGDTGYLVSLSRTSWDGYRDRPNEEGATYGQADRSGLNARLHTPAGPGELTLTLNLLDLDAENPGSLPADMRDDPGRPAWNFNIVQGASKEVRQGQLGARWATTDREGLDWDVALFGVHREVINPIPSDIIDLTRDGGGIRIQVGNEEATTWGPLRWYAGVEGELQEDDRLNFANQQGERGEMTLSQAERVRSLGLFAQGVLPLPSRGELMVGVRHDRHEFRARDRFNVDDLGGAPTSQRSMDALSPSVGTHLPLNESVDLFASVSTFFETPSTTELANRPDGVGGFNPELEPQRGTSGELGLRVRMGEMTSWEVTGYRTNLRNELIPFEVADTPGRTFFRNAGTSLHQGVEGTLTMDPPTLPVRGDLTYTWTDARFRSFELEDEDLSDNRIPGLAPHRAYAALRVTPGNVFGEVSATYAHRIPVNDSNTEFTPSHTLMDLRLGLREMPVGHLSLSPWLAFTNVLDRSYMASVAVNAFGGRYYEPGPGRSVQVGIRAGF